MPDPNSATPYRLSALAEKGALIRLAMIGAAVLEIKHLPRENSEPTG